jgi:hypothetical protein
VKGRCPRPLDDGGEATAFSTKESIEKNRQDRLNTLGREYKFDLPPLNDLAKN